MTTPTTLPPAAADPVLVMLEALIHLEAFDAFGWLVAVLEAVAMPWRDRRERLALLYLRRGFLDLAADEWITVCERRRPKPPCSQAWSRSPPRAACTRTPRRSPGRPYSFQPDHPAAAGVLAVIAA
ncbi:MAG: hypothetical protein H0U79_01410 [Solirubrobacterales bacterium]|nr:hypothetical protein [Solirubrobacterales bacterium]